MKSMIDNKTIVLGVYGGIAAYKSAELLRLLVKSGARVRVIMTQNAKAFVGPLTFEALSGQQACTSLFEGEGDASITGLRIHVGGKARITIDEDGLPVVDILELSLPVPGPIREGIEREIQVQLRRADLLPVRFTSAEWRDGEVVVRGVIR